MKRKKSLLKSPYQALIPLPVSATPAKGQFRLSIHVQPGSAELLQIGRFLAAKLAPAAGFVLELKPGGTPPPLNEGAEVGFSQLMVHDPFTFTIIGDVFRELAALTPGP